MLHLRRKPGESIVVMFEGRAFEIQITAVHGRTAILSMEPDDSVTVIRSELLKLGRADNGDDPAKDAQINSHG